MSKEIVEVSRSFIDVVEELMELEYGMIGAYKVAIENLEDLEYKDKFREFKANHKIYVKELFAFLVESKQKIQMTSSTAKHILTNGKIKFAPIFGNEEILSAILQVEESIITAYERADFEAGIDNDGNKISKIVAKALEALRKHKDWIQLELEKYGDTAKWLK